MIDCMLKEDSGWLGSVDEWWGQGWSIEKVTTALNDLHPVILAGKLVSGGKIRGGDLPLLEEDQEARLFEAEVGPQRREPSTIIPKP